MAASAWRRPHQLIYGGSDRVYIPHDFRVTDAGAAVELIRRHPFGALISVVDGEPLISHLPFSIAGTQPRLHLSTHLANANPHAQLLNGARVRVVFSGEHGYISPRWYTNPTRTVPTWNYAVVHCSGTARIASDAEKRAILTQLITEMESAAEAPWSMEMIEHRYRDTQIQHILAFYINVESVEAKFKLSQNRIQADRDGAIAGLRESGTYENIELADTMERVNSRRFPPARSHADGEER